MTHKTVGIFVPCYNEAVTIKKVIDDFKNAFTGVQIGGFDIDLQVYVYDNNSTDDTANIAREAGAIVCSETRQGKGNVIRSAFRDIDVDCLIMVDGDDTYEANDAVKLAKLVIEDFADMAIGDRLSGDYFTENKRRFHGWGNNLVRTSINVLFGAKVHDIMTGYRSFSKGFIKTFPVLSKGFEVETEMTIHALDKDMRISEVTVGYRDRPAGSESKLNTVVDGIKVCWTIATLVREYRPMGFYGIISAVLLVLGIGFGVIPVLEFLETHNVSKFPTLIGAGFLILTGVQIFIAGLISSLVAKKHRQLFEINLNLVNK